MINIYQCISFSQSFLLSSVLLPSVAEMLLANLLVELQLLPYSPLKSATATRLISTRPCAVNMTENQTAHKRTPVGVSLAQMSTVINPGTTGHNRWGPRRNSRNVR